MTTSQNFGDLVSAGVTSDSFTGDAGYYPDFSVMNNENNVDKMNPEQAQAYLTRRQLDLYEKYGVPLDDYMTQNVLDPEKRNARRQELLDRSNQSFNSAENRALGTIKGAARQRGIDQGTGSFNSLVKTASNNIELQKAKSQQGLLTNFNNDTRKQIGV